MKNKGNEALLKMSVLFVIVGLFVAPIMIVASSGGSGIIIAVLAILMMMSLGSVFLLYGILKGRRVNLRKIKKSHYQTDTRHCIHCHEEISTNDTYCPNCGTEQTNYIVCDYCGHQNNKHNLQCEKCNALIK